MILFGLLLVFALVTYFKPTVAVGLILSLLPTYLIRFSYHGVPTTFLELLLLIFLGITLVRNVKNLKTLQTLGWLNWAIGLFVLSGIIGTAVSPDLHAALGILKAFIIEPVLFFYALKLTLKNVQDLTTPLNLLFLSAVIISFLGIGQYFTFIHLPLRFWGTGAEVTRIVSVFEYPNALALYLAPLLSFFLAAYLFEEQILNRKNLIVGLVFIISALFLTFSRGAWIASIMTLLIMLAYKYDWKKVALVGFVIALALVLVPATRMRLGLALHDSSSMARGDLYNAAFEKIKTSPIVGNGLGGFRSTLAEQFFSGEILNYPHNIFFNFWVEMGILGLISFFGIMFIAGDQARRRVNWYTTAAIAYLLTMIIHGLVDVPYFKNDLAVIFWFIIAIFYIQ